jgi:hypothetical protein
MYKCVAVYVWLSVNAYANECTQEMWIWMCVHRHDIYIYIYIYIYNCIRPESIFLSLILALPYVFDTMKDGIRVDRYLNDVEIDTNWTYIIFHNL